jgi:hypothetical protein
MSDSQQEGLQHFVAKWYAREPEMQFAEVFVPTSDKLLFHVWGALLNELKHTLFELSDAQVTQVKTAWWADEFQRLSNGQSRHPITQVLPNTSLPWSALSSSLLYMTETTSMRAGNTAQAVASLLPFSAAVIEIEDALFDAKKSSSKEIFAVHCLLQRLPHGLSNEDRAGIPMHLMARHALNTAQLASIGQNGLLQDWAAELDSVMVNKVAGSLFRSARTRFDQARLVNLIAGKGFVNASAVKHLWRAWRAALAQSR